MELLIVVVAILVFAYRLLELLALLGVTLLIIVLILLVEHVIRSKRK